MQDDWPEPHFRGSRNDPSQPEVPAAVETEILTLDVETLAWALHGWRQCDFGYCEGADDHREDAEAIAHEYAALAAALREVSHDSK